MKLLKQLLEAKQPVSELSLERQIELLDKRVDVLMQRRTIKGGGFTVFAKLMPRSFAPTPGASPHAYTYCKVIDTRLCKDIKQIEYNIQFQENLLMTAIDFHHTPQKYFVIPADQHNPFYDRFPLIWIANKEVMKQAGCDEDDFRNYVEHNEISDRADAALGEVFARLKDLKKRLARKQKRSSP